MGIFLRFILPSLPRRCLAYLNGTCSPRLHFCREPNLASDRREPLCSCRVNIVPLGNHASYGDQYDATNNALKRRFIVTNSTIHPCRGSLGLTYLWLRACQLALWYQEMESNHRHAGYEPVVLPIKLSWHM